MSNGNLTISCHNPPQLKAENMETCWHWRHYTEFTKICQQSNESTFLKTVFVTVKIIIKLFKKRGQRPPWLYLRYGSVGSLTKSYTQRLPGRQTSPHVYMYQAVLKGYLNILQTRSFYNILIKLSYFQFTSS